MDARTVREGSGTSAPPGPGADPSLLQANERTLLAWIRTGTAVMAVGFVIARIGVWLRAFASTERILTLHPFGTAWVGAAFVGLGAVANGVAAWRYHRAKQAIRAGREVDDDGIPVVFALSVTALGAAIGVYLLRRLM